MFSRKSAIFRALVAGSVLLAATACRSRGNAQLEEIKPEGEGGDGGGEGADDGTGPKIMGYEYMFRVTEGMMNGKYSDKQTNESVARDSSLEGVKSKGQRITLEHYPIVRENFPHSDYGYSLLEVRNEVPDTDFWDKRVTVIAEMGYILPKKRMIAPVVGIHWEWNHVDLGLDDSPEVAKSDIRASLIGVDFRQKIWGAGEWYAAFYQGRVHLLNPTMPNHGWEAELGLGSTFKAWLLRTDLTLGYLEQRYTAKRKAIGSESEYLKVESRYQATMLMLTVWI